jgi:hypothetical protein
MLKYKITEQTNEVGKSVETLESMEIPDEKVIDKRVIGKIRKRYNIGDELQMLRKGILNPSDKDFLVYNNYVADCVGWGNTEKIKAEQDRQFWVDKYRGRKESEKSYIDRIKPILSEEEIK